MDSENLLETKDEVKQTGAKVTKVGGQASAPEEEKKDVTWDGGAP